VIVVVGNATRTGRLLTDGESPSKCPSTTFGPNDVDVAARAVRALASRSASALSATSPSASRATVAVSVVPRDALPANTAAPRMSTSRPLPAIPNRFFFTVSLLG
jgi:hypothetical protein